MSTTAEIRRALAVLFEPGDVFEVRILGVPDAGTVAGRFNDFDAAVREVIRYDDRARGIYVTLQHTALEKPSNALREHASNLTRDTHADRYRWLPVDLDSDREKDANASDEEHELSLARALEIARWLVREYGVPERSIVIADSGNGAHVYVRIDHPASDRDLVRRALYGLASHWDDERIHVDRSVHNPSRIMKLAGTMTRKGEHTAERPQRRSRIVWAPKSIEVAPAELLERLAALAPEEPQRERCMSGMYSSGHDPNVDAALCWYGVACAADGLVHRRLRDGKLAVRCPNAAQHTTSSDSGTDCVVFPPRAGETLGVLHCSHSHCEGKTHADWKALLSPCAVAAADAAFPKLHPDEQARRQDASGTSDARYSCRAGSEGHGGSGQRTERRHDGWADATPLRTLSSLPPPRPTRWVGPVPIGHVGVISGGTGAGKTFLLHYAIRKLVLGIGDDGEPVEPMLVILVDNDNSPHDLVQRLRGVFCPEEWQAVVDADLLRVRTLPRDDDERQPPKLYGPDDWAALIPTREQTGGRDVAIVIDSANSAMPPETRDEGPTKPAIERLLGLQRGAVTTVVMLANLTKNELAFRGNGTIKDKLHYLIEVRDMQGVESSDGWRRRAVGPLERPRVREGQAPIGERDLDVSLYFAKCRPQGRVQSEVRAYRISLLVPVRAFGEPTILRSVRDVTVEYDQAANVAARNPEELARFQAIQGLARHVQDQGEVLLGREGKDPETSAVAWLKNFHGIGRDRAVALIRAGGVIGSDAPLWLVETQGPGLPERLRPVTRAAEESALRPADDSAGREWRRDQRGQELPKSVAPAWASTRWRGPAGSDGPAGSGAPHQPPAEPLRSAPSATSDSNPDPSCHGLALAPLERGWSVAVADGWERLEPGTVAARLADLDRAAVEQVLATGRVRLVAEGLDDPSGWVVEVPR